MGSRVLGTQPLHGEPEQPGPAVPIPSGTVTFFMSDIQGSTQLWERFPDAMPHALLRHDHLLRAAIVAHGGFVVKTIGDSFYAAFDRAGDALAAMLAAQRAVVVEAWGETGPLRVRMVLHSGTAQERDLDFFGPTVNRTARLLAIAHGGQMLLSASAAALVRERLPEGAHLQDLGGYHLRDLQQPEQVFQLVVPDLPADFPALAAVAPHPQALPAQTTDFIGREELVRAVQKQLLQPNIRLLTLTGPGGVGKTRLSLQVAESLLADFRDGVFLVPLEAIADPALLPTSIAKQLGVREIPARPLLDSLKEHLRPQQLLLLLDNFEHLLPATPLVGEMLAAAPQLKILVTSRTLLRAYGEHDLPVPPLELPNTAHLPPLAQLAGYEAIRLFVTRAQAARADFMLTEANAHAVVEICRRLDGLPLAIELAAARSRLLPPEALLARLEQRLPLLRGGARDLPARHQTLRSTIEWSYNLMGEATQELAARLAIFAGGCTLEAAETLCASTALGTDEVLDGITTLVEMSLLRQVDGEPGEPRFAMLQTIREYALERLQARADAVELRRAHALFFVEVAERAAQAMRGAQHALWLARLEQEHDNLRAALEWALDSGEDEIALRLGGALWRFWDAHGHFSEGRRWLEAALLQSAAPTRAWARALAGAGALAHYQGDYESASRHLEEALAVQRAQGDEEGVADSLNLLGMNAHLRGNYEAAQRLIEESLARYETLGDQWGRANSLLRLGFVAMGQGDYPAVIAHHGESLRLQRQLGDQWGMTRSLFNLGIASLLQGALPEATQQLEESLALSMALGDLRARAMTRTILAISVLLQGEIERARALLLRALSRQQEAGDKVFIVYGLIGMAGVASQSDPSPTGASRAARLLGAAQALRDALGTPLPPAARTLYELIVTTARAHSDPATFDHFWRAGQAMTLHDALALATSGD